MCQLQLWIVSCALSVGCISILYGYIDDIYCYLTCLYNSRWHFQSVEALADPKVEGMCVGYKSFVIKC